MKVLNKIATIIAWTFVAVSWFLLLSGNAFAGKPEIMLGGVTTHYFMKENVGSKLKNKINNRGIIANRFFGIRAGNEWKGTFFVGENSVGGPIAGVTAGRYFDWNFLQLGITGGLYIQQYKNFTDRGIEVNPLMRKVVGIAGIEVNPYLYRDDIVFVKLNNLFTPFITTHNISVGFTFDPVSR